MNEYGAMEICVRNEGGGEGEEASRAEHFLSPFLGHLFHDIVGTLIVSVKIFPFLRIGLNLPS